MRALETYELFLKQFFETLPEQLLENTVVYGRRVFHDPKGSKEWCEQNNITPHSFGLYLGEHRRGFEPSPYAIERASRYAKPEQKVILDEKGAWLFLCDRDSFGKAIQQGDPKRGSRVFVYDANKNILGYGVWLVDVLGRREQNKPVLANKLDMGARIRRK